MTREQTRKLKLIPQLLRAIKLRCLDCSGYSYYELKNCVMPDCPLYNWREGKINELRSKKKAIENDHTKTIREFTPTKRKNIVSRDKTRPTTPFLDPGAINPGCATNQQKLEEKTKWHSG